MFTDKDLKDFNRLEKMFKEKPDVTTWTKAEKKLWERVSLKLTSLPDDDTIIEEAEYDRQIKARRSSGVYESGGETYVRKVIRRGVHNNQEVRGADESCERKTRRKRSK